MERFVSRHATAAHLALLAVAPLFLFPVGMAGAVGNVLLWLSAFATTWVLMLPVPRSGEAAHLARVRVAGALVRDPLFWTGLAVVALTGLRIFNGGIGLVYQPEAETWSLSEPWNSWFPGSVPNAGYVPWCAAVAALVLLLGVHHALDPAARIVFCSWASVLSGLAAAASLFALACGHPAAVVAASCPWSDPSHAGTAFGLATLLSLAALGEAVASGATVAVLLTAFALLADALALLAYAPMPTVVVFAAAVAMLLAFLLVRSLLRGPVRMRWMLPLATAFVVTFFFFLSARVLGGTPAAVRLPGRSAKATVLFPPAFAERRAALSEAALRVWRKAPWKGCGLGAFPDALRFSGDAETWRFARERQRAPLNGYLGILAERGAIGLGTFAVVFAFLLWTYVRSFAQDGDMPLSAHSSRALFPLAAAALLTVTLMECSFARADVILMTAAALAMPVRPTTEAKTEGCDV